MRSGNELRVAVDIGSARHRVAVGMADGRLLDEFDIEHDGPGLADFFARIARHEKRHSTCAVAVAMEGHGGYARPLDAKRMQADLQAACPGLLAITGQADNLWFLNFITLRDDLVKLKGVRRSTLLATPWIGKGYAAKIKQWQAETTFADEAEYLGPMIIADARQMLVLRGQILALEAQINVLAAQSTLAARIRTVPGFGPICSAELAGEIGSITRFAKTDSLAMYLGVAPLDNSSGKYRGSKVPKQINRRARDAMMLAAVHHVALVPKSKAYFDRKRAEGKSHQQAVRATARILAKVLYAMLKRGVDYEQPANAAMPSTESIA